MARVGAEAWGEGWAKEWAEVEVEDRVAEAWGQDAVNLKVGMVRVAAAKPAAG